MLKNYFKVAFRNIRKHKSFSLINMAGLTVGLACCLLMLLYVTHELSYDRHHPAADRIHRVVASFESRGRVMDDAMIPVLPPLESEFAEVERSCRLFTYSWREKALVAQGERFFYEDNFFLADSALMDIFAFDFVHGDPASALEGTDGILLSRSAAEKFFPDQNPLGEVISVKNLGQADFVITGVFEDMPANSHFHADYIAPLRSGEDLFWEGFLTRNSGYVYARLAKGASPAALEARLPDFFARHLGERGAGYVPRLQPLTSIHLHSHLSGEIEPNSDIKFITIFSLLALVILLTAGFNYVNLATARSAERAMEVGLRKVVGAGRPQLVAQFIGEAVMTALLTLPPALLLVEILLPAFNHIVQRELSLGLAGVWILGAVGVALLVGLLAGCYPALVLSGFRPIQVLKGRFQAGGGRSFLRSALVVAQFAISVTMIIGTLIVAGQMRYIGKKNLGFKKEHVIVIPMKDHQTVQNYNLVKTAFLQGPLIHSVTASRSPVSDTRGRHSLWYEGMDPEAETEFVWNAVDYDFLETYGIELAAGRGFSPEFATDDKDAYLINQAAARALGWEQAVGRKLNLSNKGLKNKVYGPGQVIGVVRDFHHRSLHESIEPMVMNVYREMFNRIAVRVDGARMDEALGFMETQWKRINPERPMEYTFFDDQVDRLYREDRRTGRILGYSTGLSLIVACLGLFGLAAFSAARRRKEIGIRKVLGATARSIVLLLSRDFARMALIANLIAWPAAYVLARGWLRDFAYRIPLSLWIFLLAAVTSLLVASLTVGFQSLRAALSDPVDEIRYE